MERWELIAWLFPERAEAAHQALELLEQARQIAANPPQIFPDLWGDATDQDKKDAGSGVLPPGQRM